VIKIAKAIEIKNPFVGALIMLVFLFFVWFIFGYFGGRKTTHTLIWDIFFTLLAIFAYYKAFLIKK